MRLVVVHPGDMVATAVVDIAAGTTVKIMNDGDEEMEITTLDEIPSGHKVALVDVPVGKPLIKYGEAIGVVTQPIKKGNHVHVHNVESQRGRGDRSGQRVG